MKKTKKYIWEQMEESSFYNEYTIAILNFILPGLGYLFLREYKRFFILFVALFALILISIPYVTFVISAYIAYDAYMLTQKAKKTGKRPAHDQSKHIGGAILITLYVAIVFILPFL